MSGAHTPAAAWAGNSSVSVRIWTGTALVLVMTARNGTSAPSDGATSASLYVPSPSASLVLTRSTVMAGGAGSGAVVTAEVSWSPAVLPGLPTSPTVTAAR